jgi:WD40 repeat protein
MKVGSWLILGWMLVTASAAGQVCSVSHHPSRKPPVLRRLSTGLVLTLAWSPNSRSVAAGSLGGTVVEDVWTGRIRYLRTEQPGAEHTPDPDIVKAVTWSPNGKTVAVGTWATEIRLCAAASGKRTLVWPVRKGSIHFLAWSPDGMSLASLDSSATARVWDPSTGAERYAFKSTETQREGEDEFIVGIISLAWMPDARRLALLSAGGTVWLWDPVSGEERVVAQANAGNVHAGAWSARRTKVAVGGNDGRIQVWDLAAGKMIEQFRGHQGMVESLGWSPKGDYLISSGEDDTVRLWRSGRGHQQRAVWRLPSRKGPDGSTVDGWTTVSWSPNGKYLAVAPTRSSVQIWKAPP